ncbi:MAG TPA: universal stress protein [Vicinamibacterales bacterium]|nr:universal stress protein [Vicinamibacterales bacterium]
MTTPADPAWTCPPRAVVAAVDFEPASARAVALAGFIAAAGDATLRVLHAERVDAPPYFTPAQIARLEAERTDTAAEIGGELKRFAVEATAWPCRIEVAEGRPAEVILAAAEQADLLVLGTHGRHGPARWWLGSVAERVVRGSHVPVLVTRPDVTPLVEVFGRVVLAGDGAAPAPAAQRYVDLLVRAVGGAGATTTVLASCRADDIAAASLVAIVTGPGRSSWKLSDTVTDALGHCARPVLFLPHS